ncbi:MAG: hypothetical protein KTR32_40700 [Granulosicoccus sp.]|nr:hypothetical protein [Granulosicoccus sp.]
MSRLNGAGFRKATQPAPDIVCIVVMHYGRSIWVVDDDAELITVCTRLGLASPEAFDGRVLEETLNPAKVARAKDWHEISQVSTNSKCGKTHLFVSHYRGVNYQNCAQVE